jgi:hypothetical protein
VKRAITFIFAWKGIQIALTEKYDVLFATSTPLTVGIPGIIANIIKKRNLYLRQGISGRNCPRHWA